MEDPSLQQFVVATPAATPAATPSKIGDDLAMFGRAQSDVGVFIGCAIALIIIILGLTRGSMAMALAGACVGGVSYGIYYAAHHSKTFAEFEGASGALNILSAGRL